MLDCDWLHDGFSEWLQIRFTYEETEENGKLLKNTLFVKKLQIFLIDLFVLLWDYYMPWRIMFLYFKL